MENCFVIAQREAHLKQTVLDTVAGAELEPLSCLSLPPLRRSMKPGLSVSLAERLQDIFQFLLGWVKALGLH